MSDLLPLNESEYSLSTEQRKTIEVIENTGLGDYLKEVSSKYSLNTFEQQSNVPIPIKLIPIEKNKMEVDGDVKEHIDSLIEAINDEATALEIPFCIIGQTTSESDNTQSTELNKVIFVFEDFEDLKQTSVVFDPEKLGKVVGDLRKGSDNTLILGHTHPITSPEVQESLLTTKMEGDLKEMYGIREPGLNLSLQDIYQLVFLREYLEDNIRLLLSVVMYNGDKVFIEVKNGKLVRLVE